MSSYENHFTNDYLEKNVTASLEMYRDCAVGVRRTGMIDRGRLADALNDANTITFNDESDNQIALFVPLDYADGAGYDVQRCSESIVPDKSKSVFVYMSSGNMLNKVSDEDFIGITRELADQTEGYVFYSQSTMYKKSKTAEQELHTLFDSSNLVVQDIPLVDEDYKAYGDIKLQASLSLYGVDLPQTNDSLPRKVTMEKFYQAYLSGIDEGVFEDNKENGTILLRGSEIETDLLAKMWDIYTKRFQWLGENHPISMEDTRQDFENIFCGENTFCSVSFKNGNPVCFSDLLPALDQLYWLNQSFISDNKAIKANGEQLTVFFPGIVSDEEGANKSADVIGLLADVTQRAGGSYRILFENTNRSERYIPRIVRRALSVAISREIETPEPLDVTEYKLIHYKKK